MNINSLIFVFSEQYISDVDPDPARLHSSTSLDLHSISFMDLDPQSITPELEKTAFSATKWSKSDLCNMLKEITYYSVRQIFQI